MKKFILLGTALFVLMYVHAQTDSLKIDSVERHVDVVSAPNYSEAQKVYRMKPAVDIPLTAIGTGWTLYAFTVIYSKDTSTTAQILALNKNDITPFNRGAIDHYSDRARDAANLLFYSAMPLPIILMFDKKIRNDAAKIAWLYLEAMSVTGILYTSAVYFHDKYRPYAYNPEVSMGKRKTGGAKNSFYAGHVALVGTSTFFVAKTYADYHPQFKAKWLLYTIAGGATATTGYLRYRAGEHFPTDILIGAALGPLSGLLIPQFHKHKAIDQRLSIVPFYGREKGIALTWNLGATKQNQHAL